jgi:carboxypeptidase PM20D1
MKVFRRFILLLLILLMLFIGYVLYHTFAMTSKQLVVDPSPRIDIPEEAIHHFSRAIQIPTVSPENSMDFDSVPFERFNDFLRDTYPLTDSLLDHQLINKFSHLYHWKGSDGSLEPVIFMGHLDVVPVIPENMTLWKQPPFEGNIVNDTLWGRGSIDDKIGVVGIMESVENLLKQGFQPERDIYLAFGHDEEIGGEQGAKAVADYLIRKNVRASFVMDEGGVISSGMVPGIDKDVALVGIAEKGFVSLRLSIELEGGHSSMPARESAIDVISSAVARLKANPFPAHISPPVEGFLRYLGPEMPFVNRMAFANKDIFKKLIIGVYEESPSGNALVRTTTAPTIFNSGVKDNIIPLSASAVINFRILSGSSISEVRDRVSKLVDDPRIRIEAINFSNEPSKVSGTDVEGFETIHRSIAEVFHGTLVSPYLMVAATDTKHYASLSDQIYRFSPTRINRSNVKSFHGLNERIAISEFENAIQFYTRLIQNSAVKQP